VTDEISSPTYAPDLALAIVRLLATEAFGFYHFTNEGVCSRHEFALEILRLSGRGHIPVDPITSDQYQRASTPPPYAPLRNFCGTGLGLTLRPWQEALEEFLSKEKRSHSELGR
jgi:dTDP-4-dehydrorhamnose reductase